MEEVLHFDGIDLFKRKVSEIVNLDLSNYKNNQLDRRIVSLMQRNGISSLITYYKMLKSDKTMLDEFTNMLTINVSEFFRNVNKFKELETKILPELLSKNPNLKIWSAGCSIGAEIYSIAMILDKLNVLQNCKLIASDFDKNILVRAKIGIYNKLEMGSIPDEYYKYFKPVKDSPDKYQIDRNIINKVRFEAKDLLNSSFERNFDLVLCRNVTIYFTKEANEELYDKFHDSLRPNGILFIGSSERIYDHRQKKFKLHSAFFYEKIPC